LVIVVSWREEYEVSFVFITSHSSTKAARMSPDRNPRKQPQQERSRQMRARILDASQRVLRDDGALGFTTTRVAEEAGISGGSLYQYFPNKHALVAALHQRDVDDGAAHVMAILDTASGSPRQTLRGIVSWFFETEVEEAATLGAATGDIEVFLRDGVATAADADRIARAVRAFGEFVETSRSVTVTPAEHEHSVRFAMVTIESIGKALAARQPSATEVRRWVDDTTSMLADHLTFE